MPVASLLFLFLSPRLVSLSFDTYMCVCVCFMVDDPNPRPDPRSDSLLSLPPVRSAVSPEIHNALHPSASHCLDWHVNPSRPLVLCARCFVSLPETH